MSSTLFAELEPPLSRANIVPRDYQVEDHDGSFRLWDAGVVGVLTRCFTGGGKSLMFAIKADTWLRRGQNYKVMVVSYETQLVDQFAGEIKDYLGIEPGIEMGKDYRISADAIPPIVVASRQSLLRRKPAEPAQIAELAKFGITKLGACTLGKAKAYIRLLRSDVDPQAILDDLEQFNDSPETADGYSSRLHKFDWRFNWLVNFDEAHRHAHHLVSVGHIPDWFDRNPESRRNGNTATPKRGDGVSIGHKMFPGISLNYPLYSSVGPCAVKDGYAVPYIQKYIEVEGVDFRQIKRIGNDFDEADLARVLDNEATLAKLVDPILDLVGGRRTLTFSPSVEMAKHVAMYINARAQAACTCGVLKWYPLLLIGDGAQCKCGRLIEQGDVIKSGDQARELDGNVPRPDRIEVYDGHKGGSFQFLSVCGLCREGYNDPDIGAVGILRPVSKKASSLAEQMKGRGCRPARSIAPKLHLMASSEERRRAIAESSKPDCLIIDLVGVSSLADCASTVEIYAEGLPDEIRERAEEILADNAVDDTMLVEDAIEQAQREDAESKERAKQERETAERHAREEFEKRAKADAQVTYTTHDVGVGSNVDPSDSSDGQLKFIRFLGMEVCGIVLSKRQAGRMIGQLRRRISPEEVARTNGLSEDQWKKVGPSIKALKFARWKGVSTIGCQSGYDASKRIDAKLKPNDFAATATKEIASARNLEDLNAVGCDLRLVKGVLPSALLDGLVHAGVAKKAVLESMARRTDEPPF